MRHDLPARVALGGSNASTRGASIARLQARHPEAITVHTPIHASRLNRVEIYSSKVRRKVLTPDGSQSPKEVEYRLHSYEELCDRKPQPFAWVHDRRTDRLRPQDGRATEIGTRYAIAKRTTQPRCEPVDR